MSVFRFVSMSVCNSIHGSRMRCTQAATGCCLRSPRFRRGRQQFLPFLFASQFPLYLFLVAFSSIRCDAPTVRDSVDVSSLNYTHQNVMFSWLNISRGIYNSFTCISFTAFLCFALSSTWYQDASRTFVLTASLLSFICLPPSLARALFFF